MILPNQCVTILPLSELLLFVNPDQNICRQHIIFVLLCKKELIHYFNNK